GRVADLRSISRRQPNHQRVLKQSSHHVPVHECGRVPKHLAHLGTRERCQCAPEAHHEFRRRILPNSRRLPLRHRALQPMAYRRSNPKGRPHEDAPHDPPTASVRTIAVAPVVRTYTATKARVSADSERAPGSSRSPATLRAERIPPWISASRG